MSIHVVMHSWLATALLSLGCQGWAATEAPATGPTPVDAVVDDFVVRNCPFSTAISRLTNAQVGCTDRVIIQKLLVDPEHFLNLPVTLTAHSMPLRGILDQLTAQTHCRWRATGDVVLIDHPLDADALAVLTQALTAIPLMPNAEQADALDHAARSLMRCGDADAVIAVAIALGNPALDHIPPADLPAALLYQRVLISALGAALPTITRNPWDNQLSFLVLGSLPRFREAVARTWRRGMAHQGAMTPLLCYLAGACQLDEALPGLHTIATHPGDQLSELDATGHYQALALLACQAFAIWALGELHDTPSAPELRQAIHDQPGDPLSSMRVMALEAMGDLDSAQTIAEWRTTGEAGDQGIQYMALARLKPSLLPTLLTPVPPHTIPGSALPEDWWQMLSLRPVAEMIAPALSMDHIDANRGWMEWQGLQHLCWLPRPIIEPALRAKLAASTDPHLVYTLKSVLASMGDTTLLDALFAEYTSPDKPAFQHYSWENPAYLLNQIPPRWSPKLLQLVTTAHQDMTPAWALLGDPTVDVAAALAATYFQDPLQRQQDSFYILDAAEDAGFRTAFIQRLQPLPGKTDPEAAIVLKTLAAMLYGTQSAQIRDAVVHLLHHPDRAVVLVAASVLLHDYFNDESMVPVVEWERTQPLADLPDWLVKSTKPWELPGPLRTPLLLETAVYCRQIDNVLGWINSSQDAVTRSGLCWWLGIHTLADPRMRRAEIITTLLRLSSSDPDHGVVEQSREMLGKFLTFTLTDGSGFTGALGGSCDDYQTLKNLDHLTTVVTEALAKKVKAAAKTTAKSSGF